MKVLLPSLAGRSEFVARFMREIKVLASLEHPNIAALRTAFTADDQFVMIMEYVEGTTLAERLERGPFSTADALNYTSQVLAALSYAHSKHVIHRDIKPGNMMLTPQGVVKLMDFGLARSADEVGLTMTGTTLGSLDYASPEQVQSQPTDERSDLYSVGVSLYQMVTGQRMFSVTSSFSIMEAQIKTDAASPDRDCAHSFPRAERRHHAGHIERPGATLSNRRRVSATRCRKFRRLRRSRRSSRPKRQSRSSPVPQRTFDPGFTVPDANNSGFADQSQSLARTGSGADRSIAGWSGDLQVAAARSAGSSCLQHSCRSRRQPAPATPRTLRAHDAPPQPRRRRPVTESQPAESNPASPTPKPPAVMARKAQPAGQNASALPAAPAEDIQAQQQAALEQKQKLDAMEKEIDQLDSRAAAAEGSIDTLEQQLHQSGLGLRGDVVASRASMRTDIAKRQAGHGGFRCRTCAALHRHGAP